MSATPAFHFSEVALSARLRPWFLHCWEFRVGAGAPTRHHVPPDGCTSLVLGRGPDGTPSLFTSGPWTTPLVVPAVVGGLTRGIRFTPGSAPVLLGVSAETLVNRVVPLGDQSILPTTALMEILGLADSTAIADALNGFLPNASRNFPTPDPLPATALGILWLTGGTAQLPDVARQMDCSPRTLLRRMRQGTGLTPKQQARIIRFHAAARILQRSNDPISHAAARSGYADQPHFHHEVVALTGLTPAELRERIASTEHRWA